MSDLAPSTRQAHAPPLTHAQFARDYLIPNKPLLMRGAIRDWPAVRTWAAADLATRTTGLGDIQVPNMNTPAELKRLGLEGLPKRRMSLHELLVACAEEPNGPEIYAPALHLPPGHPLWGDIGYPSFLEPSKVGRTTAFLGRNTKAVGHYHPQVQALLCQTQGTKHVWMYPPSELPDLALHPVWSEGYYWSQVNWYGQLGQFPRAASAKCERFVLNPGDALFIPMHWLHVAEGSGWSVSVTHWWDPSPREWPLGMSTARSLVGLALQRVRERMRGAKRWV